MNKTIVNKQAGFDYQILETYECGIVLQSDEIKSVRSGRVNLKGSYGKIFYKGNSPELFLVGAHFHSTNIDPYRTRKLLAHKNELKHLVGKSQEKGLTLVPTKLYIKKGMAKVQVGVGKGKREFDKRETIKRRDLDRAQAQYLAQAKK